MYSDVRSAVVLMVSVESHKRPDVGANLSTTGRRRQEGNVLFNDALNTFYLRLYGVGHNYGKGPFR